MNINDAGLTFAYNPGTRARTTHCVIHHAAANGSVESVHQYHLSKGWAGIAYHYYVRKDGTVFRGRPEAWNGGHTTSYNKVSIGVCFEGNFENENMKDIQLTAGQNLISDIKNRFPGIVMERHSLLNATGCPGKNFPFTMLVNPTDGSPEDEISENAEPQSPSAWAGEAWAWATSKGITDGTRPQAKATREEIITMLWRALK